MKSYLLFDPNARELSMISGKLDFLMRRQGIAELPDCIRKLDGLRLYAEGGALRMAVCDVTVTGVLPVLEQLRHRHGDMKLVLVADGTVPPVRYIKPTILPTALLWRPLQPEGVGEVLREVLSTIPGDDETPEDTFSVEVRGVVKRFACREILFFESRDKKLLLHLQRREIPFPGTLEKLLEELPGNFIRVHKSYIVNRSRVAEIQFGQNQLILEGGIPIPISRSYKAAVKEVFA